MSDAIPHPQIDQRLKSELEEVALRQIADRHDADQLTFAVDDGDRCGFVFAHDFAQVTERVVLTNDGLALERNVPHPWI